MGIPRLSKDVAPYAETVVLGRISSSVSAIHVTNLVIDGPSLVYHVYNAVMRNKSVLRPAVDFVLPSYKLLNSCLARSLADLAECGVQIRKIIFDGALPVSKRSVRIERLEQGRRKFDIYRKTNSHLGQSDDFVNFDTNSYRESFESTDLSRLLWSTSGQTSADSQLLPPPPFMVASAIEHLQNSAWSNVVHIVPGEADRYCASEAVRSSSAILSNDSDFLLYDLGMNGTIVLLHSLEHDTWLTENASAMIKGQCYRPTEIAKTLNLPSLTAFGYRRSVDTSVSTATIVQRACIHDSSVDAGYVRFKQEYRDFKLAKLDHAKDPACLHCSLQNLDPRTSELACSIHNKETLHVYCPIVLEDITRISSWSYGSELRHLAYSILIRYQGAGQETQGHSYITEHLRRGPHISESHLQVLSEKAILVRLQNLVRDLRHYFISDAERTIGSGQVQTTVLSYYMFAASIALTHAGASSALRRSFLFKLFPSNRPASWTSSTTAWDTVHTFANVQCILYSLRILRQAIGFQSDHQPAELPDEVHGVVENLMNILQNMPAISDLFLGIEAFRYLVGHLPIHTISAIKERFMSKTGSACNADSGDSKAGDITGSGGTLAGEEPSNSDTVWRSTQTKSRPKLTNHTSDPHNGKRRFQKKEVLSAPSFVMSGNNMFASLRGNEDLSDVKE